MVKWALLDLLGRTVFWEREPPPRVRDPSKPMQVICVGFPRTGTESLQNALIRLGYDGTYHGWDILFEEPHYMQAWCRLVRKKWNGAPDGQANITRADFDGVLGHCMAVTDTAGSVFAAELIAAYPEAKVVLNLRRDEDAWYRSAVQNLCVTAADNTTAWLESWITSRAFWSWMVFERLLLKVLFRGTDDSEGVVGKAIRQNGRWVYREHCNMIRGLVPKENLLEFDVLEGWEPLCKFLEKDVPDEPFPHVNFPAGFQKRTADWFAANRRKVKRNLTVIGGVAVAGVAAVAYMMV